MDAFRTGTWNEFPTIRLLERIMFICPCLRLGEYDR